MRSISSRWLRRLLQVIRNKSSVLRRKRNAIRRLILENLEPRALMSASPWVLPEVPTQAPDAGAPVQRFPHNPVGDPFIGPREKVWISEAYPTNESGPMASFRIERSNAVPALKVSFHVLADSTAQKNVDYLEFKTLALFEPGQSYVDVPIVPIDDSLVEPTESIRIVLWDTSRVGTWVSPDITSIQITDNDFLNTTTSVELLPPVDGQEGYRDGRLRARRTGSLAESLTVDFELSAQENLIYGEDIAIDPASWSASNQLGHFVFPAGESLSSVFVSIIDDLEPEGTEWMDIRLLPDTTGLYQIAGKPVQTLRVLDNDANSQPGDDHLAVSIALNLVHDTGVSSTDRVTSDERLSVWVDGKLGSGSIEADFDWNGDFIPDATLPIDQTPSSLVLDPRAFDPELAQQYGNRSVRYRTNAFAKDGALVENSPWSSFDYRVIADPEQGPLRLEDLRLSIDTGNASDRITTNPSVSVSIHGQYPSSRTSNSKIGIQWDHDQDGIADHASVLQQDQRLVLYDPRLIDPDYTRIPGARSIRVRLVDQETQTPLVGWQSIDFTMPDLGSFPWIVTEVSHSNSPETPREWMLQGRILDPSSTQTSSTTSLEDVAEPFSIQIDTDEDHEPNATVPVERDGTFEYVLGNLRPGTHVLKLRVQQWSSQASMMVAGAWMPYELTIEPPASAVLPIPRLRSDTGASTIDRITSDPTLCIEIPSNLPFDGIGNWIRMLDIESDTFARSVPVPRSIGESPSLVVFQDESIAAGIQRYRLRTRVIDPTSDRETSSEWVEFPWTYEPVGLPPITLSLLSDDGVSSADRMTSIATVLGQVVMDDAGARSEAMRIEVDWDSDGSIDAWTQPMVNGQFTIRPDRVSMGHRRVSARLEWTDPYRNIPVVGNWTTLDYQLTEPELASSGIGSLGLWIDTGHSSVDRISSVSTIQGILLGDSSGDRVEVDRDGDRIADEEVVVDASGRFRYTPMGLSHGSHLFHFRSMGLSDDRESINYSSWQPFDFTFVASTMEPVVIESLKLTNDSGNPGDNRSEQGSITGRVTSGSGVERTVVLVDVDQDRQADATLTIDPEGRFLYDPSWVMPGQYTVSFCPLRIGPLQWEGSTPELWIDFTFVLEDQPDTSPELYSTEYVSSDPSGRESLQGRIRWQRSVDGVLIELDTNGDGLADRTTKADAFGEYSFELGGLAAGHYDYKLRARPLIETGAIHLVGGWQSVRFEIDAGATEAAKIHDLRLSNDDGFRDDDHVTSDPRVYGRVDRAATDGVIEIEVDITGDSLPDDSLRVGDDLTFEYTPTRLEEGAFRLLARTKEVLASGKVLRGEWVEVRGTLVWGNGVPANDGVSSEHGQGLSRLMTKLGQDRQLNLVQSEEGNERSLMERTSGMLQATEAYWTQTAMATQDFAQHQSQSLDHLREQLRAIDSTEVDLPLPEELALLWPSDALPNLPYLVSEWLPPEEAMPIPPVVPPAQATQSRTMEIHWSKTLTEALEGDPLADIGLDLSHDSEYQDSLQRIRSDLLAEFRFADQQSRIAKNRAQSEYDLLVGEAQTLYRQAMAKNGSEFESISLEDYSGIYLQFVQDSQNALAQYQVHRKNTEDRYRVEFQRFSDAFIEQKRTLERNRDEQRNSANRELASVLNTVPPPDAQVAKASLVRHAKIIYDGNFLYEQSLVQLQASHQVENYELQQDQVKEFGAIELSYATKTAELERLRDMSVAEVRYQYSAQRANLANRWDSSDEIASRQFHESVANAWAQLERTLLQIEADRRVAHGLGLLQFDFARASLACLMLTRVQALVSSPESNFELQLSQHYRESLRALKPFQEQRCRDSANLWKQEALAKIDAEYTKRLGVLADTHAHRMERIEAVEEFRLGHARLVRSHAFELAEIRYEAEIQARQAQQSHRLERDLSGIVYLQGESAIACAYRSQFLEALVYQPPKLDSWTGGWGWIDGNFLGAVSGSATIAPEISHQLLLDERTATAKLAYENELRRIANDQGYFDQRDSVQAAYQSRIHEQTLGDSSREFQLQKQYHLAAAQSDHRFAVTSVHRIKDYESSLAQAKARYRESTSQMGIRIGRLELSVWSDYQRSVQQIQFERTIAQWDLYVSQMQRWRDSEPIPWTDYQLEQARLSRNVNVERAQILLDRAREESLRRDTDQLVSMQMADQFEVGSSAAELQFAQEELAAVGELGLALADAKYELAEQTSGSRQDKLFGIHLLKTPQPIPNFLPLKKEVVRVTAAADTRLAAAVFQATVQRADANYRRSMALATLWSQFDEGDLDWDRYYEQVALVERVYSDKLQQIDSEHLQERTLSDETLRVERAEIVRLLAIEHELAKSTADRWAWLEDVPNLATFGQPHLDYAQSVQDAQDRFAERLGMLQISSQESLAELRYQRELELGRVRSSAQERQGLLEQNDRIAFEQLQQSRVLQEQELRNAYETQMLRQRTGQLDAMYRKLDPETGVLLKRQVEVMLLQQARIREAKTWKSQSDSSQSLAYDSDQIRQDRILADQLFQVQLHHEEQDLQLQRDLAIQQARQQAQWMIATKKNDHATTKSETQIRAMYDQRSEEALRLLNKNIYDQHIVGAQIVGDIWRDYYLRVHPRSTPLHASMRRELDNWMGLGVVTNLWTSGIWRLEPLPDRGISGWGEPTAFQEFHGRLVELQDEQVMNRNEYRIAFAVELGAAKVVSIQESARLQQEIHQERVRADEDHVQGTYTALRDHQIGVEESRLRWIESKDRLELSRIQQQNTKAILALEQSQQLERQYQQRVEQASIDYQRAWADIQGGYHASESYKKAQDTQRNALEGLRSEAMVAHAMSYAHWIQEVSGDYVDWVGLRASAQGEHRQRLLVIEQQRELGQKKAQADHMLEIERIARSGEQEKSQSAFQGKLDHHEQEQDAHQEQSRIDSEYRQTVLENESKFLQEVERAESAVQIMKLRGYSGFEQARERSSLVSTARHVQALGDSAAMLAWTNSTAQLSIHQHSLEVQRSLLEKVQVQRMDAQLERQRVQVDQAQAELIAQARFEYQVHAIGSKAELGRAESEAQSQWLVASAGARVIAREQLRQAIPGDWSDLLFAMAEHELDSIEQWKRIEDQWIEGRSQVDNHHSASLAQAQRDHELRRLSADREFRESEIQQELESVEVLSQIELDYQLGLHEAALELIEQMGDSQKSYSDEIAAAELGYHQDLNRLVYQQSIDQARQSHESRSKELIDDWNRKRMDALALKRIAESELQRSESLNRIERESLQASRLRDGRRELIGKEAEAYRVSEEGWSELEKDHAIQLVLLQTEMAEQIDQQVDNAWSEFLLDVAKAKSEWISQSSEAKADRIQAQSNKQAAHEKQQGDLQWEKDQGEWIASDMARRGVAELDWIAQQDRIRAMRESQESDSNDGLSIQMPEPEDLIPIRLVPIDRRYELLDSAQGWWGANTPFAWQDTGFLSWVRSPQEQFSPSYWSLETLVQGSRRRGEAPRLEKVAWVTGAVNDSKDDEDQWGLIKTSTLAMAPASPWTQQVLATVDRELWADAMDWLDLHGRLLGAAQRPDHRQLCLDQSIRWDYVSSPMDVSDPQSHASERFFVKDSSQWGEFLDFAERDYGAMYQSRSDRDLQELFGKYKEHLGEEIDRSKSKLLNATWRFNIFERRDRVIQSKGVVYWQHTVGIEPSRIEGVAGNRVIRTAIGRVDRLGWVNLPSGKRVLFSALKKWADELVLGSSDQVNALIDGMISPYRVDPSSAQYGIFIGGTGMHLYGIGNVERLYNLYQGTKFYYGGVGNPTEYDSLWNAYADNGAGYGWTAILDRIEADVIAHYRGHQKIHIFGWSRGAAMAIEFSRRMARYQIDVDFLGLFDPVYSYILPGQSSALIQWSPQGQSGNYVTAVPTRNAKSIGVIYAANEDRSFFPATRLYPSLGQSLQMMKSPGAHGEIGGHFLSNPIIQRLNMRAMIEFATNQGQAAFRDRGMDPDLARVFASGLTRKLQLGSIQDPIAKLEARRKVELASRFDSWQTMQEEEYYRELVDSSLARWKLGGFGFQRDRYSGLVAFGLEFANENSILSNVVFGVKDGVLQQSPLTHYRRNLDWCKLELWDMEFLRDQDRSNRLTENQKEAIRKMYSLRIDPKTGDWIL